ncbi:TerD family protein [Nocardia flavorosea]|uniref:TerD family protein n=1 Tax=Nocardia flavorosea TaxID=53429 RepID=A0A846YQ53_9NOCA|nr:TerD family protein [Nocardia flavorosea]NKY59478.1 TerD family protein [Nocardia flavorosea]
MKVLQAGQNIALDGGVSRFQVHAAVPLTVSALVVATDLRVKTAADVLVPERPTGQGVQIDAAATAVVVTLAEVRADAQAVLLTASAPGVPGVVTARLSENDTPVAEFVITPQAGETALICFELYRRGTGWRLRALGQGYAGGIAELLRAHGAQDYVTAVPPAAATTTVVGGMDTSASAPPAPTEGSPLEVGHGLERLWMIFEDAARSAAALESARDYAAQRLDQELSAAVSDPATRNTPAADAARTAAQGRYDELTATAENSHQRDSAQLQRELAEADAVLPAALASWNSPAWDHPAAPADGIRLGELYALDRSALRIPYCVPVPLNRPLWVDTESSAAVAPVIGALLARLLRAAPGRRTIVDIIDLTGAFTGFTGMLAPVLAGPPINDHADISPRLQQLVDAAELAEMAYNSGQGVPPAEHRILLAADFPHGYQSADAQRLAALLARGDLIGLSTVIVGTAETDSHDNMVATLSRACRHLPTIAGTPLFDPWTNNAWQLDLDMLPHEPEQQARILRAS